MSILALGAPKPQSHWVKLACATLKSSATKARMLALKILKDDSNAGCIATRNCATRQWPRTQGQVSDWRVKITKAPAVLQDKTNKGSKPRAASSINRDMAVLKAALNLALHDGYATNDSAWKYKLLPIKNRYRPPRLLSRSLGGRAI